MEEWSQILYHTASSPVTAQMQAREMFALKLHMHHAKSIYSGVLKIVIPLELLFLRRHLKKRLQSKCHHLVLLNCSTNTLYTRYMTCKVWIMHSMSVPY